MTPETGDASHLLKVHRYTDEYFQTMVARLYNFDGSRIEPGSVLYTNYVIHQVPAAGETAGDVNGYARVITRELPLNGSQIRDAQIAGESGDIQTKGYADLFSDKPYEPVRTVPSLQHYRFIHESENNATATLFGEASPTILLDSKTVKIFEYVKGAHISGKGIIEVPVVTNTGRKLVYSQESVNGEFVVPYSTTGNQYDVRTTGPYRIAGTPRNISVTEEDILNGNLVP